jgi:hypothetical protein
METTGTAVQHPVCTNKRKRLPGYPSMIEAETIYAIYCGICECECVEVREEPDEQETYFVCDFCRKREESEAKEE